MANDDEILGSLKTLAEQQNRLLESLKSPPTKKDAWDRFSAISTFLSTVAIALIGIYFTNSYNRAESQRKADADRQEAQRKIETDRRDAEVKTYQAQILEMQTVERFIPHLIAANEDEKKMAILTISSLSSPKLATNLGGMFSSKGTREAVDVLMATAAPRTQTEMTPSSAVTTSSRNGWAYLGDYVASEHRWRTRYFDFGDTDPPETLKNKNFAVRSQTGSLNVRADMPTPQGDFPAIINVIAPGTHVQVGNVRAWSSTGYIWAQITY